MQHVAIDLGGYKSQVCLREPDGTIVKERLVATRGVPAFLGTLPPCRVILETCSEAFAIARIAVAQGHDVRVVPATLVRTLGVGSRRVKNDRKDAQVLSEVSTRIDLPSVHVPALASSEAKSLCSCREALVESRTKLINTVRGWMRTTLNSVRTGAVETFPARARESAVDNIHGLPAFIETTLCAIEALTEHLRQLDKQLRTLAESDKVCRLLMTAPIGPVTAVSFVAAVDQLDRFPSAHDLESYLGLTTGDDSSSQRIRKTGITKAGSSRVRRNLVQSCWSAWRRRPKDPLVCWAQELASRRNNRIAIVAMARKLAGILFAMWRDGTVYDPQFEAKRRAKLAKNA